MREILFRGKQAYNDEWAYSEYPFGTIRGGVVEHDFIPETVGQYTGLTVPSGKIFEHDIVTAKFKSNGARFNFTVKYSDEKGCYVFDNGRIKVSFCDIRSVRIIGNIHDNSELLKWLDHTAADIVEVVRCKDCKYSRERNEDEQRYLAEGILICTSDEAADERWNPVYPSHFCSCGERKE